MMDTFETIDHPIISYDVPKASLFKQYYKQSTIEKNNTN
jgi:hypothetical protein